MVKPVGILGGTFDPVHHGHLRLAIECLEQLDLQEVRLVPLHTPPHRQPPHATPEQRLEMLQLATATLTGLTVDDSELHRENISYTIDTVAALRQKLDDTPLCLIMGGDAFEYLHTWRDWRSLSDYVHIVIADRSIGGANLKSEELADYIRSRITDDVHSLHNAKAGKIINPDIPLLNISATQIRQILGNGQQANGLLPEEVLAYIHTHQLYKK